MKENCATEKPVGPWYQHFEFWSNMAYQYIAAHKRIPLEAKHHAELRAFSMVMGFRLIFESNLIEHAGLSKGDTQKIIQEHFPLLPQQYETVKQLSNLEQFRKQLETIPPADQLPLLEQVMPRVTFRNKSRKIREVLQHYQALTEAVRFAGIFSQRRFAQMLFASYPQEHALTWWRHFFKDQEFPADLQDLTLISEEHLKSLHKVMAANLLPDDAGVSAGEYRIDLRSVGDWDVVFPAPELVPDCMKVFVETANKLFGAHFTEHMNIFEIAARISYDFVRIHPFPDFNGRLSRLLLTSILMAYGVPFPITLRGDKKGRKRYFTALKRANKGKIRPYATLIAMRVAETFQAADENIRSAGYPSILSFRSEP